MQISVDSHLEKRNSMKKYELDPQKTLAILIGISDYDDFDPIKPAANNVNAFAKILEDKDIFGIPKMNIHSIIEGTSAAIKSRLLRLTKDAKRKGIETLILYFAGHGYRLTDGTYFLATKDTNKTILNLDGTTALPYDTIKKIIKEAKIAQSIIFLDACYSGLGLEGENDVIKELGIKGGYTITSSSSTEVSYFDTDEQYTLFTGELLDILKNGLPINEEKIILSELYGAVKEAVKKKQPKMTPQQQASREITGDNFYLFKNTRFDTELEVVREIEKDIKDGDEIIINSSVRVAKRHFVGLLAEVDELKNDQHKKKLTAIINKKLDIIQNLPTYRPIVEKILKKQFEQKINQLNRVIADKESLISGLQARLAGDKKEAQSKIKKKDQLITRLKEEITKQKDEISKFKKELQEFIQKKAEASRRQKEFQKLTQGMAELDKLEKEIQERDSHIIKKGKTIKKLQIPKKTPTNDTMIFVKGGSFLMGSKNVSRSRRNLVKTASELSVPTTTITNYLNDNGFEIINKPNAKVSYDMYNFLVKKFQPSIAASQPAHIVIVPDFYIGKYQVTVKEYNAYLKDKGDKLKAKPDNYPVTNVNWMDALAYCEWLSKKTGIDYRLPSEAEWEYAARGGVKSKGYEYAGSPILGMVGWYDENSDGEIHPVGDLAPNELGIYDMSGNVLEWCLDKWHDDYEGAPVNGSAWVNGSSLRHVVRGGDRNNSADLCRVWARGSRSSGYRFSSIGFRLAHSSS